MVSSTDARADLGAADVQGEELSVEGQNFDTWRGSAGNKCKVNIKDGLLRVNHAGGINRSQISSLYLNCNCFYPAWNTCAGQTTLDKEFVVQYSSSSGNERFAKIIF